MPSAEYTYEFSWDEVLNMKNKMSEDATCKDAIYNLLCRHFPLGTVMSYEWWAECKGSHWEGYVRDRAY